MTSLYELTAQQIEKKRRGTKEKGRKYENFNDSHGRRKRMTSCIYDEYTFEEEKETKDKHMCRSM